MVAHYYSSIASEMTLAAGIDGAAGSMTLSGVSGLPTQTPYTLVIDPDTSSEEIVTVTARSGQTFTITRAQEGTPALSHSTGAKVRHKATARDLRWSREHEESSVAHGRSSNLVGISDNQTLTNKTMSGANNDFDDIPQSAIIGLPELQAYANSFNTRSGVRIMSKTEGSYASGAGFIVVSNWNAEVHPNDGAAGSGIQYGVSADGALEVNTAPAGIYDAYASINIFPQSGNVGILQARIVLNGNIILSRAREQKWSTGAWNVQCEVYAPGIRMNQGDYVQVEISHTLGPNANFSEIAGVNRWALKLIRPIP